ncbi:MAG: CDP-alcohol phosphatidyltransferase family protein [Deltaproteobacteria bacterium]|nr:CDP-alcohol phosphatidyltransferase family protein [Deltaproteobacteria bacterium]
MTSTDFLHALRAWILTSPSQPLVKIWGIAPTERLRRALLAAGFTQDRIGSGPTPSVAGPQEAVLVFRADYVFDARLIQALVATPDTLLEAEGIPVAAHVSGSRLPALLALFSTPHEADTLIREAGLQVVTPQTLAPAYTSVLRKTDPPYLLPVRPESLAAIEARIFTASYKGITDLVTKWVWPAPARVVVRWLANAGVTPNTVTLWSWVLVVATAWLFAKGHFGLGLAAAWLMTFLDTVDGKLARVTLTSSPIGHVLDHGLDLLHPPFWYLAWALGLPPATLWLAPATAIVVVGYIVGRLLEGAFLLAFKMEIHCWQPIDAFFRTITARRNPNLLLLTAGTLCGRPDWGLLLVAAWTLFSIGFHSVRLLQAGLLRWQGVLIEEWQEQPLSPAATPRQAVSTGNRSQSLA